MKEKINHVSVLIPSSERSQIPSLGYGSLRNILTQAFPDMDIRPVYLDNSSNLHKTDIFIANFYSTLGFFDLLRVFNDQSFEADKKGNPFTTIAGGTGAYNPLPVKGAIDYVTFKEECLVDLLSHLTGKEPQPWEQPNPAWAKTDYITLIMPTLSCVYKCVFCQLKNQNESRSSYSPIDQIRKIISEEQPSKLLIHSANILRYPFLNELLRVLEESRADIYLGSMNLIDIDEQRAESLRRLNPKHTIASEKDVDVELFFGLESGSSRILRAMKKPLTRAIIEKKVRILRKAEFKNLGFYLILGYPDTDDTDFAQTADVLNIIADIMGADRKITVKCTPFIPHLETEVSQKPARYWHECIRELKFLQESARPNITFDVSEAFYYLTSVVLIRGGEDHSRFVQNIADRNDTEIRSDEDMDKILRELNLPNLYTHLRGVAPLDLSSSTEPFIKTEDL